MSNSESGFRNAEPVMGVEYEQVEARIRELQKQGIELDSVVVASEDWPYFKERADVVDSDTHPSGEHHEIEGVRVLFNSQGLVTPELRIKVGEGEVPE